MTSLRKAALLGCASMMVLAAATTPSRAGQELIEFFVNGTNANDINQSSADNTYRTGCCSTYVGPGYSGTPLFLDVPPFPGAFGTTSSGPGAISEASGGVRNDAYDGYGGIGMQGVANFGGLTVNRNIQVTNGPTGVGPAMTGFAAAGVNNAARWVDTLTNNTGSTISGTFSYFNNLGSDSNTIYVNRDSNNRYIVSYQNPTAGGINGHTTDPIITHIFGNNAYVKNQVVLHATNGDDNPQWDFPVSVAPGQTVRIILFNVLTSDTDAIAPVQSDVNEGVRQANLILNNGNLIPLNSPFFAGLTMDELKTVLNWDFSLATFTISLPSNAPTNVKNVAQSLDNFVTSGGSLPMDFQNLLTETPDDLQNSLQQMSGQGATGALTVGSMAMNSFLEMLLNPYNDGRFDQSGTSPLGYAPESPVARGASEAFARADAPDTLIGRMSFWGGAFGGYNSASGDAAVGSVDTTAHIYGFSGGLDYRLDAATTVGFALAGGSTSWGLSDGLGDGRSDFFEGGLFAKRNWNAWYASIAAAFGTHQVHGSRTVNVGGTTGNFDSSYNAQDYGARGEIGWRTAWQGINVTPYGALQSQVFHTPGYSEDATSGLTDFALTYDSQSTTQTRSELGAWIDRRMAVGEGRQLTVYGRLAWAHNFNTDNNMTASFQSLPGTGFIVNGASSAPDLALTSAGLDLKMTNGWSVGAKFDGEFGDSSSYYAANAVIRKVW